MALDLLRTCRHAFHRQACHGWARWVERHVDASQDGILEECHHGQHPGPRSNRHRTIYGIVRGGRGSTTVAVGGKCEGRHLVPRVDATSPCGPPALASDDRCASHDCLLHGTHQTRLVYYCACECTPCTCTVVFLGLASPGEFFQTVRDVTFRPLFCFGFYFASLVSRDSARLAPCYRARYALPHTSAGEPTSWGVVSCSFGIRKPGLVR